MTYEIPERGYKLFGDWLALSPNRRTYGLIERIHDMLQVRGPKDTRKVFETARVNAQDTKTIDLAIEIIDYIETGKERPL